MYKARYNNAEGKNNNIIVDVCSYDIVFCNYDNCVWNRDNGQDAFVIMKYAFMIMQTFNPDV